MRGLERRRFIENGMDWTAAGYESERGTENRNTEEMRVFGLNKKRRKRDFLIQMIREKYAIIYDRGFRCFTAKRI